MTGRNTGSGSRPTFLILLLKKSKLIIMATNAVHNQSASSTVYLSCASVAVLLGSKETGISDDVTTTFHTNLTSEFKERISKAHDTSTALDQGRREGVRRPGKIFSPPPPPPQSKEKVATNLYATRKLERLSAAEWLGLGAVDRQWKHEKQYICSTVGHRAPVVCTVFHLVGTALDTSQGSSLQPPLGFSLFCDCRQLPTVAD